MSWTMSANVKKWQHEFYVALKKEIETYQERASHLINTGCESPTIMARWVSKIRELGEKRRRYEALFQRQISEVDGEFNTLQGFARELQGAHRSCAFEAFAFLRLKGWLRLKKSFPLNLNGVCIPQCCFKTGYYKNSGALANHNLPANGSRSPAGCSLLP